MVSFAAMASQLGPAGTSTSIEVDLPLEKQTVNVPMWAGVGAIVVGGLLLVFGGRR